MSILLKGAPIAKNLNLEIKKNVAELIQTGTIPSLVIMLAGNDPASRIYAEMIVKNCTKNNIKSFLAVSATNISEKDFLAELDKYNSDQTVHGIIVMLPLPAQIRESEVQRKINPLKDIDGIHPLNAGNLLAGNEALAPSTAQACRDLLFYSNIETSGKNVVIIGRSNIVGKPLAAIMMQKAAGANATVTVCHSRTENLPSVCKKADILVAAIGSANFVTADFVTPDSLVIDVGMNEVTDSDGQIKLCGDVDFNAVESIVRGITPVPGGVSPLTHTALQNNLLKAIKMQK